jgi:hypothetical protein
LANKIVKKEETTMNIREENEKMTANTIPQYRSGDVYVADRGTMIHDRNIGSMRFFLVLQEHPTIAKMTYWLVPPVGIPDIQSFEVSTENLEECFTKVSNGWNADSMTEDGFEKIEDRGSKFDKAMSVIKP